MPACSVISFPSVVYEDYTPFSTFVASFDHTGKLVTVSQFSLCNDERVVGIASGASGLLMAGTYGAMQNSFVAQIDPISTNPAQISVMVDAAGMTLGPYSPLEIITVFGKGLGPTHGVSASPSGGYFPTTLAGTRLWFNNLPAPLLYVSDTQINALVPGNIPYSTVATVTASSVAGGSGWFSQLRVQSGGPRIYHFDLRHGWRANSAGARRWAGRSWSYAAGGRDLRRH